MRKESRAKCSYKKNKKKHSVIQPVNVYLFKAAFILGQHWIPTPIYISIILKHTKKSRAWTNKQRTHLFGLEKEKFVLHH